MNHLNEQKKETKTNKKNRKDFPIKLNQLLNNATIQWWSIGEPKQYFHSFAKRNLRIYENGDGKKK